MKLFKKKSSIEKVIRNRIDFFESIKSMSERSLENNKNDKDFIDFSKARIDECDDKIDFLKSILIQAGIEI